MVFLPSFMNHEQNLNFPNLQIVFRNNEGSRFMEFFKSWKTISFDYIMLRANDQYKSLKAKKVNKARYLTIAGKLVDANQDSDEEEKESFEDLVFTRQTSARENIVALRNTTTTKRHHQKIISDMVNVDASASQKKQLRQNIEFEFSYYQGIILKSLLIKYNAESIFCKLPGDEEGNGKVAMSRIFQYEIQGSKFSKAKIGFEKGIFERSTSYFIVIHKKVKNDKSLDLISNNAMFLWRGSDVFNKNKNAFEKYVITTFKSTNVQDVSNKAKMSLSVNKPSLLMERSQTMFEKVNSGGLGLGNFQKQQSVSSDIKEALRPIYTGKTTLNVNEIRNVKPKISSDECLVSLRSIITPDNEPNFFTILFSGSMVVRSYDFFEYGKDDEFGYVMLYQLIGVPHINQKAVEVPVKWESLSSTGLYIMLADENILFWIGTHYYDKFLNKDMYTNENYLISEDMLKKLNYIYEQEATERLSDEKIMHFIIEDMETDLFTKIMTKDGELDIDMPDYESKLVYKHLKMPQIPRLYCLFERGIMPDYINPLNDEGHHLIENENLFFKEYFNYDQLTFLQKGIYLLKMDSDLFIWVGSKVSDKDFLEVIIELSDTIPNDRNIHLIHENYEPVLFTQLFENWKNRLNLMITRQRNDIDEIEEENEGEDSSDSSSDSQKTVFDDEDDELLMKEIEHETKNHTRILPMDLWKKIVHA